MKKIIIPFLLSFFLFLPVFADFPKLPIHISSELIRKEPIPEINKVFYTYKSPLTRGELINFYKETLSRQGWRLKEEQGSLCLFEREDFFLVLNFISFSKTRETVYQISLLKPFDMDPEDLPEGLEDYCPDCF